ncbi:MAG: hypothetical protein KDD72_11815, partial [Anaerolineales bacterium]|nr:hypothetical protein [Anaerolineales bacterium]
MSNHPIPIIEARGTYREVGRQIGERCKPQIEMMMEQLRESVPANKNWDMLVKESRIFQTHSRAVYPQYVDELEGIAEGAGVPFDEMFVAMCEELWETPPYNKGCTDMAARGRATSDGSTLIAHTNDLSAKNEED